MCQSIDRPLDTITTKDRFGLTSFQFVLEDIHLIIDYNYSSSATHIDRPLTTIMAKRDKYKAKVDMCQFLEKMYSSKYNVQSLDKPLHTIMPNPKYRLISGILVDNRVLNVYYRMLYVKELKKAQGFPDWYHTPKGSVKSKFMIGNSAPPDMVDLLSNCQHRDESYRISGVRELTKLIA